MGIRDDIFRILKSVDIVVLSSFYEGLSLSSIEGMASGSPFVASDVPGLRDIVEGGGVLFKSKDYINLAMIFHKLLEDRFFINETINNCLMKAESYSLDLCIDNYKYLYLNISK
ncbi:glycosyltransferase [Arachidicoccus ginsenosidivorans]|uniref:Glycosyltransferase n=1 Tax=Arachidicoccus ginsenosidivorans TaxID=496057 RepID=A0A5B8VS59_9BACT|nr:glycosyltransferase [Arachidicoccus ginsenosidivorans]